MSAPNPEGASQRVIQLRKEYMRQIENPYRHMTMEGGHVFDPAVQRYMSMRVSNYEHFKPTFKSFRTGFLCVVFPIIAFALAFKAEREGREQQYRTGQVAYKDRNFKFI